MKTFLRDLLERRLAPRRPCAASRRLLTIETLDSRELLTVTAVVTDGVLRIDGDNADNRVNVSTQVTSSNGTVMQRYIVTELLNGTSRSLLNTTATKIIFHGAGGNDEFYNNTILPAYVYGEGGDDTLTSGGGTDLLDGGAGNDTYSFDLHRELGWDQIVETRTSDIDTLRFSGPASVDIDLNSKNLTGRADGKVSDRLRLTLNQGWLENVYGGDGDDKIVGTGWHNLLAGGAGRDDIFGMGGNDELYGETGDDVLHGGDGNDQLWGQEGNDWLNGDANDDQLHGGVGNDTLGATISFKHSSDTTLAPAYYDEHYDATVVDDPGNDWMAGDSGNDIIRGGTGNDTLYGGEGNDVLGAAVIMARFETSFDRAGNWLWSRSTYASLAEDGNDRISGDGGNDTLRGGDGNDRLDGGTGNDTVGAAQVITYMVANMPGVSLNGETGTDGIRTYTDIGENGNDVLHGGDNNDTVNGGDGRDDIFGDAGDDLLYCGWIDGQFDNDVDHYDGGDGDDSFHDLDPEDIYAHAKSGGFWSFL